VRLDTRPVPSRSCAIISGVIRSRIIFVEIKRGPKSQPKKSAARDHAVALRKQNRSVYEISTALKEEAST